MIEIIIFFSAVMVFTGLISFIIFTNFDIIKSLLFGAISAGIVSLIVFTSEIDENKYRTVLFYKCYKQEAKKFMDDNKISKYEFYVVKRICNSQRISEIDKLKGQIK